VSAKLGWFERAGIGHIWDAIISSQEIGVCKPEPADLPRLPSGNGCDTVSCLVHDAAELDGQAGKFDHDCLQL
jgi:hypothetical protein